MSTENIIIQIREDGSREVTRNIDSIATSSRRSQNAIDQLKRALAGITGVLAINELRKYADIWTMARGKINIFTTSAEETTEVMERLFKIAQDTRQPLEGMASSFHQLSIAGSALGASQEQLLTFTEAIGKALAIQGTDANTARGGILQLGQAMNEGIVRAQEYNSMINAMPVVLKVVANNLDGVGGSLAKLRQRMLEGKLYSKDFFEALLKGAPDIAALFERSGKTIGQSLTLIRNAMIRYVGTVDEAYGISSKFYELASWGAQNIEHIAKALVSIAAPFILQAMWGLVSAFQALALAAAANPFIAIAAALTVAITALMLYRDQIILIEEGHVSLGDYMEATWEIGLEGASNLVDFFKNDFLNMLGLVEADVAKLGDSFDELLANAKLNVNNMVGTFVGLGKSIGIVAAGIIPAFKDVGIQSVNALIDQFETGLNKIVELINTVREKAGMDLISAVSVDRLTNDSSGQAFQLGSAITEAFKESLDIDYLSELGSVAGGALDTLTAKAKELAKARHDAASAGGPVDLGQALGEGESYAGSSKPNRGELRDKDRFLKSLRTETEQIAAEYEQRNAMILKYTQEGTAQREMLQQRSNDLRAQQERELSEKMTGVYASETEKLKQVYEQRTQLIMRNTEAGSTAQLEMLAKLREQEATDQMAIDNAKQAKIDSLYSGLLTEEEMILQSYERRKQAILQATEITELQRADLMKRTEAQLIKDQEQLELQRTSMLLSSASNLFDSMAGIAAAAGGKQSAAYKVLFAASKAFALANSIVQIQAAIANAAASGPFPANLAAMATVATSLAGVISAIQGTSMVGQAHDGYDSIPKSGTWNLEKGERVVDKRTNADLKGYLAGGGSAGGSSGGSNVIQMNVNVINNMGDEAQVTTRQSTDDDGNPQIEIMIDQIEDALAQRMASGRGTLHKSTGQAFGLRSNPRG